MNISYEALSILLLLIPGFLSSIILDRIVVRKTAETFPAFVEALVFTFVIYVAVAVIYEEAPISLAVAEVGTEKSYRLIFSPATLVLTFGLSVVLPLIFGYLVTHDYLMRLLRWLRITHKTARATAWLDVFIEQNRLVIVNLNDGRRIAGWPMYYSDDPSEKMVYLRDPEWVVDKDGKPEYIDMDIHGIFLVQHDLIATIEFTHTSLKNVKMKGEGG